MSHTTAPEDKMAETDGDTNYTNDDLTTVTSYDTSENYFTPTSTPATSIRKLSEIQRQSSEKLTKLINEDDALALVADGPSLGSFHPSSPPSETEPPLDPEEYDDIHPPPIKDERPSMKDIPGFEPEPKGVPPAKEGGLMRAMSLGRGSVGAVEVTKPVTTEDDKEVTAAAAAVGSGAADTSGGKKIGYEELLTESFSV